MRFVNRYYITNAANKLQLNKRRIGEFVWIFIGSESNYGDSDGPDVLIAVTLRGN
jgi:hypothetical protein